MSFRLRIEIGYGDVEKPSRKRHSLEGHHHVGPTRHHHDGRMPVWGWIPPQPKIRHPQPQSRLLNLPAEIRLLIYETLFTVPGDVAIKRHQSKTSPSILSILQTCRQVLEEAEDIYYSINQLRYNPTENGRIAFAKTLGPTRRDAITSMTVVVKTGAHALSILPGLYGLVNLKSLYIERLLSILLISFSEWAVMAEWAVMTEQIRRVLVQMPSLQEVKIITSPVKNLTPEEFQRQVKLDEILENFRIAPPDLFKPAIQYRTQ